jgi:hypothetical protein
LPFEKEELAIMNLGAHETELLQGSGILDPALSSGRTDIRERTSWTSRGLQRNYASAMDAWHRKLGVRENLHIELNPSACFGPDEYPFAVSPGDDDNFPQRASENVAGIFILPTPKLLPGA